MPILLLLTLAACKHEAEQTCLPFEQPPQEVELEPAFPNLAPLDVPIMVTRHGTDWFALERAGRVLRFEADDAEAEVVLDITDRVLADGDAALSAIVLDPDFDENQVFYLWYSTEDDAVVSSGEGEWRVRLSSFVLGSDEETVLLEVEELESGHHHANDDMQFGPDGLLYLGIGYGGPSGDPNGHAQSLETLQGKILRIDVSPDGYTIPADNPWPGSEIWAYGLRNPWRFSFDDAGELWVGDVGQYDWEEVDHVSAGDNLGWADMEGPDCRNPDGCDETGMVAPVVMHNHYAMRSIVGGRFYEGTELDTLAGHYIYGDYVYGQLWAFGPDHVPRVINAQGHAIVSFAEDADRELLGVDVNDGVVYRIVDGDAEAGEDGYPTHLSQTGCVEADAPETPIDRFYEYAVAQPFWSDGAVKRRWLAVPNGEELEVDELGDVSVPSGSVILKEFRLGDELVETRLLSYHGDGVWSMLSYQWNDAQTDATLIPPGDTPVTAEWDEGSWEYPTRGMCRDCHYRVPGGSLGLELRQLAADPVDARLGADQLEGLQDLGWLPKTATAAPFPALDDERVALDVRARSFLHINCGYCHQPNGQGRGDIDLRYDTALADMGICGAEPTLGDLAGDGGQLVYPGHPERSVLLTRIGLLGEGQMPPIGRSTVDTEGYAIVERWIAAMPEGEPASCEIE